MYKYIMVFVFSILMSACQERYRYPCQDPRNMNTEKCSVETCKLTRTCPHIKGENDGK
jgi:hypothetical protein